MRMTRMPPLACGLLLLCTLLATGLVNAFQGEISITGDTQIGGNVTITCSWTSSQNEAFVNVNLRSLPVPSGASPYFFQFNNGISFAIPGSQSNNRISADSFNVSSQRAVLRIKNVQFADNRNYSCYFTYALQAAGGRSYEKTSYLTVKVRGQLSIVPTHAISPGGKFTVTCDASKATIPSGAVGVQQLTIYRNLTSTNSYSTIAQYRAGTPPGVSPTVTNNPPGRNWTFTFSGAGNGASNQATMRIVWDVNDVSCNDAGIYRCQIDYFVPNGPSFTDYAADQNVTVTVELSSFDLTVGPTLNQYSVDDNIVFNCTAFGPVTGVTFKWELWAKDQLLSLPDNYDTETKPPTLQTGNTGCAQYKWASSLRIQIPAEFEQQTYKCIVTYLQQQESGNLTIDVTSVKPSIVSTNTVALGRRLSVYCDASRASIPQYFDRVHALSIYRAVPSYNNFSLFAQYISYGYDSFVTYRPYTWGYTVSGGNSGINTTATMKIVLNVDKATCSDAGTYRCAIDYYLTTGATTSVQARDQIIRVTRNHPSVVSINSVPAGGTFSVYCNASRADAPEADVRSIQSLSIFKDPSTSYTGDLIAHYNSVNPPLFNANAKNMPNYGDWNITFSGDNHGSNNTATMKIVINVNNVEKENAGVYRCQISYYLTGGGFTSVLAPNQNVIVLPASQSSIVSTNSLTLNGNFLVYCDASRASATFDTVYSVQTLAIYRMTERESSYSLIALYNSVNPDFSADVKNITAGRDWNITFSGGNAGSNNIDTMKIVWEVNDVMFSDAGMYRCQIGYYLQYGGLTSVLAPDQNVTVSGFCDANTEKLYN